ncbi:hypothetical protein IE53DRAFT_387197 [Violaceomyces palustris]|uniref:Uncharacterized protein n=1 Tax=Violaceomyces palustris TaxID=1673888 RepID=A0ACD0NXE7_9BASI|nr:hypothetical protein IE53DRAFT_387197 [Violaceomyces palustris]
MLALATLTLLLPSPSPTHTHTLLPLSLSLTHTQTSLPPSCPISSFFIDNELFLRMGVLLVLFSPPPSIILICANPTSPSPAIC